MKLRDAMPEKFRRYFNYSELNLEQEFEEKEQAHLLERKLNEGLIITHDIHKSMDIIERAGYDIGVINDHKFANRFFVQVNSKTSDFDKLFKITDRLGWYCTQIRGIGKYGTDNVKYTKSNLKKHSELYDTLLLLFEPKFDLNVSTGNVDYLYHFTRKINWHRIKQNGLTPRTTDKVSTHPDRVYFGLTISAVEKFANRIENKVPIPLANKHNKKEDVGIGVILRIDLNQIGHEFKIYADPNFYKEGCYTLNSVPFNAIDIIKEFPLI